MELFCIYILFHDLRVNSYLFMINKEKLLMSNNSSVLDFRWRDSVSIRLWICSLLTANWLQPRPLTAITAPLAYPPMLGGLKAGDGPVLILESSILTELPSRVLTQLRLYSLFTAAEQFVKKKKQLSQRLKIKLFFLNFFFALHLFLRAKHFWMSVA